MRDVDRNTKESKETALENGGSIHPGQLDKKPPVSRLKHSPIYSNRSNIRWTVWFVLFKSNKTTTC